jgi:hypothetical protein
MANYLPFERTGFSQESIADSPPLARIAKKTDVLQVLDFVKPRLAFCGTGNSVQPHVGNGKSAHLLSDIGAVLFEVKIRFLRSDLR